MEKLDHINDEEFESVIAAAKQSKNLRINLINAYARSKSPYSKLFKLANTTKVSISKEAKSIDFKEPCYLSRIEVVGDSSSDISSWLSIVAVGVDESRNEIKSKITNFDNADGTNYLANSFEINSFVARIEIRSKRTFLALRATKFKMVGYALSHLEKAVEDVIAARSIVHKIDDLVERKKTELEGLSQENLNVIKAIDSNGVQLGELKRECAEAETEVGRLGEIIAASRNEEQSSIISLKEVNSRVEVAKANEAELRETISNISKEISKNKAELDRLLNDRNVISDEYKDYVSEGKKQSTIYIVLVAISIGVIGFSAWQIYTGAQNILVTNFATTDGLFAAVIQRTPFAVALGFIAAAAWKVAVIFVDRIITIHSQRLALARLLVIAKDTVFSSAAGLEVSDEKRFRERIRLKLAMLKAHLTSELGKDFEYTEESGLVVENDSIHKDGSGAVDGDEDDSRS